MPKWKTQIVTPDTCSNGQCVIYERFDTLAEPRIVVVAGYKQRCGGHDDGLAFPTGMIQATGFDEAWRDMDTHMNWERAFYRFATNQGTDPVTPPAGRAPSKDETDGVTRAYTWHRRDNRLKGAVVQQGLTLERGDIDLDTVSWWFEGVGDTRRLHVDTANQLTPQQRSRVEAATELSFGPDRITWEG